MRDYDRLQALQALFIHERKGFSFWYAIMRDCFDVPDCALAYMMGVYPPQLSEWKLGKRMPSKTVIRTCILLCYLRMSGTVSLYDLLHINQAVATGKFEKRIYGYLEWEREELARRAARKAAKEAATSTKSSTTPGETA